jgi:hypothetical protein
MMPEATDMLESKVLKSIKSAITENQILNINNKNKELFKLFTEFIHFRFEETEELEHDIDKEEFLQLLDKYLFDFEAVEVGIQIYDSNPFTQAHFPLYKSYSEFSLEDYDYNIEQVFESFEPLDITESVTSKNKLTVRYSFIFYSDAGIRIMENEYIKNLSYYMYRFIDTATLF